jgi:acyl-CoA synthetase (AMP-forming)/AMP-acid ligase II
MSLATRPELTSEAEALWWRAALARPGRGLTVLPQRPGGEPVRVSWEALLLEARGAARGLEAAGVRPGAPFLLIAASEHPVLVAFLGGLLLGAQPVPIHPPLGLNGLEAWLQHLRSAGEALGATALVGPGPLLDLVPDAATPLPRVDACRLPRRGEPYPDRELSEAYVQLTSGSTARPKGVRISHANLAANLHQIGWCSEVAADDVVVSWLPLYHDMGLVGTFMFSLYWNLDLVLLPPTAFLTRPLRWLQALSDYGGSLSPAPAFAYSYVAHRVRDRDLEGLDLSRWKVAYCGAEPIQPAGVRRFTDRLAPCGLNPGTLLPCYGLAEATLAVTFPPVGRGVVTRAVSRRSLAEGVQADPRDADDTLELVLLGEPLPEFQVEIRDAEGRPTAPGRTGAVWIRGASVSAGYLGQPPRDDAWHDTGDLGMWIDGELAVVGRRKDLIIVRGRNHVPIDLEWAAEAVDGVRVGSAVAFAVPGPKDTEAPVLACEVKADEPDWTRGAIARAVLEAVQREAGLRLHDLVLLDPGTVPRTTSGKVKHGDSRARYLEGEWS